MLFAAPFDAGAQPVAAQPALIGIVIDDLGNENTQAAMALPPEVTLAFLPDAPAVSTNARVARQSGHEVIVHMPMEAEKEIPADAHTLTTDMDDIQLKVILMWAFGRYEGYAGMNGHMGSKFTADMQGMARLMTYMAEEQPGMYFLDSATTPQSVAKEAAAYAGVPFLRRDVFLDNEGEDVAANLALTLKHAVNKGCAIAIGHPHDRTLKSLKPWLDAVARMQDVKLVPLSKMLADPRCGARDLAPPPVTDAPPEPDGITQQEAPLPQWNVENYTPSPDQVPSPPPEGEDGQPLD